MTTALEGGEGSASRPGRSLPPGKTRYPLYRRLGGPQVGKISPRPGFDPRTVQPVASRYTDWATRPSNLLSSFLYKWYRGFFVSNIRLANFRKTKILPYHSYLPIYIPAICCQLCVLFSAHTHTHTYAHMHTYIQKYMHKPCGITT